MGVFYPTDALQAIRELGLSPDEAVKEGILSAYEADGVRNLLRQQDAEQRQRERWHEIVARDKEYDERRNAAIAAALPAALAAYDAVAARMPKRVLGPYELEYENWRARMACHQAALEAARSSAGDTLFSNAIMDCVANERPGPRQPRPDPDGEPGPGGEFMRAGE